MRVQGKRKCGRIWKDIIRKYACWRVRNEGVQRMYDGDEERGKCRKISELQGKWDDTSCGGHGAQGVIHEFSVSK